MGPRISRWRVAVRRLRQQHAVQPRQSLPVGSVPASHARVLRVNRNIARKLRAIFFAAPRPGRFFARISGAAPDIWSRTRYLGGGYCRYWLDILSGYCGIWRDICEYPMADSRIGQQKPRRLSAREISGGVYRADTEVSNRYGSISPQPDIRRDICSIQEYPRLDIYGGADTRR